MNKNKIISSVLVFVLVFSLIGCDKKQENNLAKDTVGLNVSQMQSVCELAALKCYYHNTAKFDSEKEVLFWNTNKKLWVEYSGIVKVGIDFSKLKMNVTNDIVTITIPEAKVLSCEVDESSLSEDSFYTEKKGLGGGKIDADDSTNAFKAAQDGMLETAKKDESLLLQAKIRAQTLLENYVKNVGDAIGVDYKVKWETLEEDVMNSEETDD